MQKDRFRSKYIFNMAVISLISSLAISLNACGSSSGGAGGGAAGPTLSGSVGDGPLVGATLTFKDSKGAVIATTTSNSAARYSVTLPAKPSYPVVVTATGGTDSVDVATKENSTWVLMSAITATGVGSGATSATLDVNTMSTLVVLGAQALPSGITDGNLSLMAKNVSTNLGFGTAANFNPLNAGLAKPGVDKKIVATAVQGYHIADELVRRLATKLNISQDKAANFIGADLTDGRLDGKYAKGVAIPKSVIKIAFMHGTPKDVLVRRGVRDTGVVSPAQAAMVANDLEADIAKELLSSNGLNITASDGTAAPGANTMNSEIQNLVSDPTVTIASIPVSQELKNNVATVVDNVVAQNAVPNAGNVDAASMVAIEDVVNAMPVGQPPSGAAIASVTTDFSAVSSSIDSAATDFTVIDPTAYVTVCSDTATALATTTDPTQAANLITATDNSVVTAAASTNPTAAIDAIANTDLSIASGTTNIATSTAAITTDATVTTDVAPPPPPAVDVPPAPDPNAAPPPAATSKPRKFR